MLKEEKLISGNLTRLKRWDREREGDGGGKSQEAAHSRKSRVRKKTSRGTKKATRAIEQQM